MKKTGAVVAGLCALIASSAVADEIVDLGGGWQATIFNEDKIDLVVDFVGDDVLVLQKFANFNSLNEFGNPEPLSIAFNQVGDDADTVSKIVFADEFVFNNTGVDWNAFRMALLGDHATFNPGESADFDINPFDTMTFSNGDTEVLFDGGVVGDGDVWTPGLDGGSLVIDIDLSRDLPAKFVLKEIPIPAPAALALLGAAGVVTRRRRRA